MRIYFGNLSENTTTKDLLDFVSDFLYRKIDHNSVIVDNCIGFAECSCLYVPHADNKTTSRQLIESSLKELNGKVLNGSPVVVRWEQPNEFGNFLVSKVKEQTLSEIKLLINKRLAIFESDHILF